MQSWKTCAKCIEVLSQKATQTISFLIFGGQCYGFILFFDVKKYAEWNFSVRQAKNFHCILFSWGSDIRCHLTWLKYWPHKVLISCCKILAHSPNTLNAAKVRQNQKNVKSLSYILDTIVWSKNHLTLLSLYSDLCSCPSTQAVDTGQIRIGRCR
jgi:hypothetical protein